MASSSQRARAAAEEAQLGTRRSSQTVKRHPAAHPSPLAVHDGTSTVDFDKDAPITRWEQDSAYDTARECQAGLAGLAKRPIPNSICRSTSRRSASRRRPYTLRATCLEVAMPGTVLSDTVLRRLLIVKELLAALPPLTPSSDGLAVARAVLTAHDAAELALATVADVVGAPRGKDKTFLMGYAGAIRERTGDAVAGSDYLSQLNDERISFKHKGSLPNVQQWHTVGEKIRGFIDSWCRTYFDTDLAGCRWTR